MDEIMAREVDMSIDRYVEAILAAKARGLPVKLGLEVDYEPGTVQQVIDFVSPYPWDFLIASVHWIGAWWFLRPTGPAEFARRGVRRAFDEYFELATAMAETGMAD
jgi:histidinol-phosphatase (PHP family)